jgi:hypothetical protein
MKEFFKKPFVMAVLITLLVGGGMYVVFEVWLSNGSTMDMNMEMEMNNQSMEGMENMEGMNH